MISLFIILDVLVVLGLLFFVINMFWGKSEKKQQKIKFSYLNEKHREFLHDLQKDIHEKESKILGKKKISKEDLKKATKKTKRTFVLNFKGGVFAEEVEKLRHEITAILLIAKSESDEVVLKLDSPGGTVNGYGLAASQLQRIKDKKIKLTVLVDQVAASGGYMMASVANQIVAAPFAYIGSVGVVAEFPNFNNLIEKLGVQWKTYTAGESKRNVGTFGKITPDAEKRLNKKLVEIHQLFKKHIKTNRPQVDVDKIGTGEVWTAAEALDMKLVDGIRVSDEYVLEQITVANVYNVYTPETKSKLDKILETVFGVMARQVKAFWLESQAQKFM